jgi:hypothetical protein
MVGSMVPNKPFDGERMTLLEWIRQDTLLLDILKL